MIQSIRALLRLVLFFIVSLATVLLVAIGNVLITLVSDKWAVRWKNIVIKSWAWITGIVVGLKLTVKGTPPKPPFFLVSNHLSYIDVIPLWRYLDATFVAKSEIQSWPFFGWATKTLGVLFINRELKRDVKRMNDKISDVISANQGVIIFPEGTSTKGAKVESFNAPLLQYPAVTRMPVDYATITYESTNPDKPAHLNICWWGDMEFFPHFWELLKLKSFKATITFGEQSVSSSNRKILADELKKEVNRNFSPVIFEED
ncbi:lysophospholipid acyltransferase family protein [Fodinibius halophilus]|uniref:1-acyl-sn-glycerol-3-phosphate acyltransferase n=1 Tax=Fodinibius halophilus TaxID=1736908 RepID=A0A6M1T1W0_9BACT|nr:lysophospholipid acyltransferase family protein [Fodinibius halophilus]NGP87979.1 1-acyl-sn-glycerol-3-phosphate acyltransferase [Fodinibius halophilus]